MTRRVPGLGHWLMADDLRVCLARCEKLGIPVTVRRLELGPISSPRYGLIHEISPAQLRQESIHARRPTHFDSA